MSFNLSISKSTSILIINCLIYIINKQCYWRLLLGTFLRWSFIILSSPCSIWELSSLWEHINKCIIFLISFYK
nr:MAG TPA: hypothetical protein [Caudoviricetes sp.]